MCYEAREMVRILSAQPEHFVAVGELLVQVFIGEGYAPSGLAAMLRDVAAVASTAELLVAEADSGAVGCVALARAGRPHAEIARDGEAEFRMLAVAPAARRLGAGELLVKHCIQLAQSWGCDRLVLSTDPRMKAAQRLYLRLGFFRERSRDWVKPDGRERVAYALAL
jgi:ribosomal protein S18 acetylase RimI-like enzyme